MWVQVEDGRLVNLDYGTSVVPDHGHGTASLYGYEVLLVADSRAVYRCFFNVDKSTREGGPALAKETKES